MAAFGDPGEHKRRVAEVYNIASAGYDKEALWFFRRSAERLVALAAVRGGENILDVATGTGVAAIAAARAAGPSTRVTGVDIAEQMLERARENARVAGLVNVAFHTADAEHLPFADGSFDAVLCAAGIFFLPEMIAGARELHRVTKTGGRTAISSFGETAFQPMSDLFEARLRRHGVSFPLPRRPFSWQRLADPEKCGGLLREAACTDVAVHTAQLGYHLRTANEWWDIVWNSGFRGPLSQLPPERIERFKGEHLAEVWPLATEQGIWLDVPVIFAVGHKAAG